MGNGWHRLLPKKIKACIQSVRASEIHLSVEQQGVKLFTTPTKIALHTHCNGFDVPLAR